MNENETPLTIGATEDTGKRPAKARKKTPAKKAVKLKKSGTKTGAAKKPAPKAGKSKTSGAKKPGKSKKAVPAKVGKKTAAAPSKKVPSSGKKPGKSAAGSVKASRKSASSVAPTVADPSTAVPVQTYGISRIDQPAKKNHGFYVRLGKKDSGLITKFFSDKKLGSAKKALAAATAFRDEQFALLPDKLKLRAAKPRKPYTRKAA